MNSTRHVVQRALPPQACTISRWASCSRRNGTNRPWTAHFAALRVTPAHDWRTRRLAPEVWLLFERDVGTTPRIKAYLVSEQMRGHPLIAVAIAQSTSRTPITATSIAPEKTRASHRSHHRNILIATALTVSSREEQCVRPAR
jgi:hypothetical protein